MLDAASYPILWRLSAETKTPPEFFVAVMASESGLNSAADNGVGFYGINQMAGSYLQRAGISPADYVTWPASEQLQRIVAGYFKAIVAYWGRPPRSPGVLYSLNFCQPDDSKDDSPARVIAPAGRCGAAVYAQNVGLDVDKNGAITIADLDDLLCERVIPGSLYRSTVQALYADASAPAGATPAPVCQTMSTTTGSRGKWLLAAVGGVTLLGAAYYYRRSLRRVLKRFY